jgi:hypothetical protein
VASPVEDPLTPCRRWRGPNIRGYGRRYDRVAKRTVLLHRWVWERVNGPIPEGLVVMHICDTPACFRYEHLRLGTQLDNIADMTAKGRAVGGGGKYKGEQVTNASLTNQKAAQLRADRTLGASFRELAGRYGVSKSTAHRVCAGQTYRVD